ncbi:uncharacterized protein LOC133737680 [Rosa rugosa]|uniref:uncharacterized protein LOC133737680 n=1 Tax=Rosa rugosa TaxID=74645 RepID=UPI002B412A6A|nr:uncharacterized protein LOC133737680 [Rosa rugosa]
MRISHCDTAKQAWDLLQVTYEGNKKVRGQKLQILVLEFENMTMGEDESIDDFHARLLNVTNQFQDDTLDEETNVKCKQLYHASKIVLRKNYTLEKEIDSLREEKEKIELQFETFVKEWNVERTNLVDKIKVLQDEVKSEVGDKEHGDLINKIKILQNELLKVKKSFNKFSIGSEKVWKVKIRWVNHMLKKTLILVPNFPKDQNVNWTFKPIKKFLRVTQNQRKTMGINSHASLQAELKEGLNLIARIAKLASIPVDLETKTKQKQIWIKKETPDQLVEIQKLHQEKKERDEKKLEIMKEKIEVDKEKLRVRKLEVENRKIEAEMRIMSMDTSTMNPEQRHKFVWEIAKPSSSFSLYQFVWFPVK